MWNGLLIRKKRRIPLSPAQKNKRDFLRYLRDCGVMYSNDRAIFILGHFVIKFTDCNYLTAYTPTPAVYRETVVSRLANLQFPYTNAGLVYSKLQSWHYALFRVPLKKKSNAKNTI